MIITDFLRCHLGDASLLALSNYYEERFAVPALPQMDAVPDLAEFADGGLGVAAVDCGKLAGFLCFYPPWDNAFTTAARGTFSPVHAHGAVREGRELIYRRMYQAAAEKLVGAGIASHAVSLYAHDAEAIHALFTYGFGLRCVDAIMLMEPICGAKTCGLTLRELDAGEAPLVRGLRRALSAHLAASPCFMYSTPEQFESWLDRAEAPRFAAFCRVRRRRRRRIRRNNRSRRKFCLLPPVGAKYLRRVLRARAPRSGSVPKSAGLHHKQA